MELDSYLQNARPLFKFRVCASGYKQTIEKIPQLDDALEWGSVYVYRNGSWLLEGRASSNIAMT